MVERAKHETRAASGSTRVTPVDLAIKAVKERNQKALDDTKQAAIAFENERPVVNDRYRLDSAVKLFTRPRSIVVLDDIQSDSITNQRQRLQKSSIREVPVRFQVRKFYEDGWPADVARGAELSGDETELPCYELETYYDGDSSSERRLFVDATTVQRAVMDSVWPSDTTPEEDFAA